jgi:tRNA modification GTPase
MFSTADTIVAIATPPGRGGIGVVRLSGSDAHTIARVLLTTDTPLEPRHATFGKIRSADRVLDHAVVTLFPGPHSYTGDDVVEVSAHGSPVVLQSIVAAALAAGARLAEPGEFTLRAFLNNRLDLPQAEAVADLIDAVTPLQARTALDQLQGTLTDRIAEIDAALFDLIARLEASVDFPEEGYHFVEPEALREALGALLDATSSLLAEGRRGRLIREGLQVAIVGKPNVGKSTLFNALAGCERAIVTAVPGTTRDLVTEIVDINGMRVTLVDSAGVRVTDDTVESIGVELARKAMQIADVVLVVLDGSCPLDEADRAVLRETCQRRRIVVANKRDVADRADRAECAESPFLPVSAKSGTGVEALRAALAGALDAELLSERPSITNLRHVSLVERADEALRRACDAIVERGTSVAEELVLADLQIARDAFEEISGRRTPDDLLAHIFSRFCIGK